VTVTTTGCPHAAESLTLTASVPNACWPAPMAACVQTAPFAVGWQFHPLGLKSVKPVESSRPELLCPPSPPDTPETELPAGRLIAAVIVPVEAEPVSETRNESRLECPNVCPLAMLTLAASVAEAGAAEAGALGLGDTLGADDGADDGRMAGFAAAAGRAGPWELAGVPPLPARAIVSTTAATTATPAVAARTRADQGRRQGPRSAARMLLVAARPPAITPAPVAMPWADRGRWGPRTACRMLLVAA
jgi:hypothetical protein